MYAPSGAWWSSERLGNGGILVSIRGDAVLIFLMSSRTGGGYSGGGGGEKVS